MEKVSKGKFRRLKKRTKNKSKKVMDIAYNIHHILYQKRHWCSGYLLMLRDYWYCKISIPKSSTHRIIHEFLVDVPVPKVANAKKVLEQLRLLSQNEAIHETDNIEQRLIVLISLFEPLEQPTTVALKAQLQIIHNKKPP